MNLEVPTMVQEKMKKLESLFVQAAYISNVNPKEQRAMEIKFDVREYLSHLNLV